ncbi:TKL protein kinase, variant [Saprolegnia diclina VS20]|nr:TKL protein kinase, variant [Saprolegnia diclina VS20]EQC26326.1 TKL protein kinase, variant [Saprolegnia diclina VS20]|eukprot:XP_008620219.1 TKL protein kinase, variant [Saprolegnia diclina VS20]
MELWQAAFHGRVKSVRRMLKNGADLEWTTSNGSSALCVAAGDGHADIVSALIDAGANVNHAMNDGSSPLLMAVHAGAGDIVDLLLAGGADVNLAMPDGETALYAAAQRGEDAIVSALLSAGASVDLMWLDDNQTPLYIAAYEGHASVVQLLLDAKASVDVPTSDGATAVFVAAQNGDEDIVRRLLAATANVHLAMDTGVTPLYIAAVRGHAHVVSMLLQAGANVEQAANEGETPLLAAAQEGLNTVVKMLLEAQASVDQPMNNGRTPLYSAARGGHADVVGLLLTGGAAVDRATNDGDTPLLAASRMGHVDVVRHLLDAGASVNQVVQQRYKYRRQKIAPGATPLFLASLGGHAAVVRALLRLWPNVNAADASGDTALSVATRAGHTAIVSLLLDAGATLSGVGGDCASVLDAPAKELLHAVAAGDAARTRLLVDNGASPNIKDQNGDTLLHLAVRSGKHDVLEMLLRAPDVDLNPRNKDNETPLVLAIKLRHRRIPQQIYSAVHHIALDVPEKAIYMDAKELLGDGGFGYVHKGIFKSERVAVKSAKYATGAEDLHAEIHAMQTCNSPYLLELMAVSGQDSDSPKLVLEYMDGGNLRQYLDKKRKGEPTEVDYSTLDIAWVIANGLADLHRNGYVHRDLKSLNVLLSSKNYIKVADFGLTKEFQLDMTTFVGTPAWTAPEVFESGATYDFAADIYSFGVILTELDSLQVPYTGMNVFSVIDGVRSGELRPSPGPH